MKNKAPKKDYNVTVGFFFTRVMKASKVKRLLLRSILAYVILGIVAGLLMSYGRDNNMTIYWIGTLFGIASFVSLFFIVYFSDPLLFPFDWNQS